MSGAESSLRGAQIRMPLFDRLLDAEEDTALDHPQATAGAIARLDAAVKRDLEALLNARRRRVPLPGGLAELPASPVGYGIPDPTAGSFTDEERRQALAAEIAAAIRRFEPRLNAVRVTLARLPKEQREPFDRTLRIRVEAVLRSDPVPEEVAFETVLRPVTLDVSVRDG